MEQKRTFSLKNFVKLAIGALLIAAIAFLAIYAAGNKSFATEDGNITIICNDINDNVVSTKRCSFKKGDTLFGILTTEYNVSYQDTEYGHYLTGIGNNEFDIQTDGASSWIWFELAYLKEDCTYSDNIDFSCYEVQTVSTGIDGIQLVDNMIFALNEGDSTHEASIINKSINVNSSSNTTAKIVLISISVALLVGIISFITFDIIKNRTKIKLTVKDLALIAFLAALLFVQEELLTFLPNIQLTVFLIVLYSKKLGLKRTSIIVTIHVILDNLFMASFSPIYTLPMLIGWLLIPLTLNTIFKKANSSFTLALLGILYSFIYCWIFVFPSVLIMNVRFTDYMLADVVFEMILALSSFVSIWLLYDPSSRIIDRLYDNEPAVEEIN